MHDYQREFIEFLVCSGALRFGAFTSRAAAHHPTSSIRANSAGVSRSSGSALLRLGDSRAQDTADRHLRPGLQGIPLSISAAIAFKHHFEQDVAYSFDRKEEKDHGEGGWIVGHVPVEG